MEGNWVANEHSSAKETPWLSIFQLFLPSVWPATSIRQSNAFRWHLPIIWFYYPPQIWRQRHSYLNDKQPSGWVFLSSGSCDSIHLQLERSDRFKILLLLSRHWLFQKNDNELIDNSSLFYLPHEETSQAKNSKTMVETNGSEDTYYVLYGLTFY